MKLVLIRNGEGPADAALSYITLTADKLNKNIFRPGHSTIKAVQKVVKRTKST